MRLNYETVGPRYFQTMRIQLVRGRDFDERDREDAHRVVIINETMARRYWPKGGALGQRLKLTGDWLEIVGVAKDVKNRSLSETPRPLLYLPLLQGYRSDMILVTRTSMSADSGRSGALVPFEVGQHSAAMWGRIPLGSGALFGR